MRVRYDGYAPIPDYITKGKVYECEEHHVSPDLKYIHADDGDTLTILIKGGCPFLKGDNWTILEDEEKEMEQDMIEVGDSVSLNTDLEMIYFTDSRCTFKFSPNFWLTMEHLKSMCDETTYKKFENKHKQLFPHLYPSPVVETESGTLEQLEAALKQAVADKDYLAVETLSKAIQRVAGVI